MDKYTKFILTIIAVSLLWISLNIGDMIPSALAAYSDTNIKITDVSVPRHRAFPVYVTGEVTCR